MQFLPGRTLQVEIADCLGLYGMSRTGKNETLNEATIEPSVFKSIHHITNKELFKGKVVELDEFSKQPCFKGVLGEGED